jgi:LIVCS family branched-chain amino acid:cation transporter
MYNFKIILSAGLAMFAMFFGSGNLVFPLNLGVIAGDQYVSASFGFIITGVLMPFLGLFSVMLYDGNRHKFFGLLGSNTAFVLTMVTLMLMGPFGVVPRCILVSYGAFAPLFPDFPLWVFSLIFSLCLLIVVWKPNSIVPIIARFLGPIKISTILFIIIAGIIYAPDLTYHNPEILPMSKGIVEGFQTMDLPAAFFFSVTIVEYLKHVAKNKNETFKLGIASSLLGGGLIALIYCLFTYLGAHYSLKIAHAPAEEYLAMITRMSLGNFAAIIFAVTMFFACLTTASTLAKLFAEFLSHDICREKLSWSWSIIITTIASYILSLAGFAFIASTLGVILTFIYPALIVFTISSIAHKRFGFQYTKHAFWGTIIWAILIKIV